MAESIPEPLWQAWHDPDDRIRLGVSTCLLGEPVRFDGGHKRDAYLNDVLGDWVDWVPSCPEVDVGLSVPRPTLRLESSDPHPRLVITKTREDLTEKMETYAERRVAELQRQALDGYILKKASPSCGMERVRVYGEKGQPSTTDAGVFARILLERWPELPVEEEGRLKDPRIREGFMDQIFSRHRWRLMETRGLTRKGLVAFHTAHKLLLRVHNEAGYRRLGRLVASAGTVPDQELFESYSKELARTLRTRTTVKRHANVLFHGMGYLKKVLAAEDKAELLQLIEDYRNGLVPLVVPVTLLRHHVRRHSIPYLSHQLYLDPNPRELMLRNRV